MEDYKELIGDIEDCLIAHPSESVSKLYLRKAADAVEQLVKERDAAVADLKTATLITYPCHFCGKVNNCKHDNLGIMCMGQHMNMARREFEWRGVQK